MEMPLKVKIIFREGAKTLPDWLLSISILLVFIGAMYLRSNSERRALQPILIATGNYEPFCGSEIGLNGKSTVIVDAVLRELGYDPSYQYLPWPISEKMVTENEFEPGFRLGFPYFHLGGRSDRVHLSGENIGIVDYSLFVRKGNLPAAKNGMDNLCLTDFKDYTFILQEAFEYPPEITNSNNKVTTNTYSAFELLVQEGGAYVLPSGTSVGKRYLERYFPKVVKRVEIIQPEGLPKKLKLFMAASRRNPNSAKLLDLFDKKLIEMRGNLPIRSTATQFNQTVILRALSAEQRIVAYGESIRFIVPSGTRARILHWGSGFVELRAEGYESMSNHLAQVQFVNGPMKGTVAQIDATKVFFTFVSNENTYNTHE